MADKVLTISVAAYNADRYIDVCLSSFLACRNLDKLDVIVVDDGSTDDTAKLTNAFVSKAPDSIRLISKENGGHGSTINTSIANAKGKYYKVVDADDWVDPAALDRLVDYLSTHDVDVAINPYVEEHESNGSTNPKPVGIDVILPNFNSPKAQILQFEALAGALQLFMHTLTFMTKIVQAMPQIDEHCFYVDVEYVVYPIEYLSTAVVFDDAVYHYRLGTADQSVNKQNLEARIGQHEHVLFVLSAYLENHVLSEEISATKKKLAVRRVAQMANTNYMIYLRMESEAEASKILQFDSKLQTYPDVYSACTNPVYYGKKRLINYLLPRLRKREFGNLRSVRRLLRAWDALKNNQ